MWWCKSADVSFLYYNSFLQYHTVYNHSSNNISTSLIAHYPIRDFSSHILRRLGNDLRTLRTCRQLSVSFPLTTPRSTQDKPRLSLSYSRLLLSHSFTLMSPSRGTRRKMSIYERQVSVLSRIVWHNLRGVDPDTRDTETQRHIPPATVAQSQHPAKNRTGMLCRRPSYSYR